MALTPLGRVELDKTSFNRYQTIDPDYAAQADRFRDKAAEAQQLADIAKSPIRRETLRGIAKTYLRTAKQLEAVEKPIKSNMSGDRETAIKDQQLSE